MFNLTFHTISLLAIIRRQDIIRSFRQNKSLMKIAGYSTFYRFFRWSRKRQVSCEATSVEAAYFSYTGVRWSLSISKFQIRCRISAILDRICFFIPPTKDEKQSKILENKPFFIFSPMIPSTEFRIRWNCATIYDRFKIRCGKC